MRRSNLLLDLGDGLTRVEAFRAGVSAVHDGVAAIQLETVIQLLQALFGHLVPGVLYPPIGLHQHCGTQVLVGIPPIRGTGGGAAGTQDALVHAVQLLAVLFGL